MTADQLPASQLRSLQKSSLCDQDSMHGLSPGVEDDKMADLDEPHELHSWKDLRSPQGNTRLGLSTRPPPLPSHGRKASLLTQALLTSPDLKALSPADEPVSTKEIDSAKASSTPRILALNAPSLKLPPPAEARESLTSGPAASATEGPASDPSPNSTPNSCERTRTSLEESLARRRCISFACGKDASPSQPKTTCESSPDSALVVPRPQASNQRRPCALKFACLARPARAQPHHDDRAIGLDGRKISGDVRNALSQIPSIDRATRKVKSDPSDSMAAPLGAQDKGYGSSQLSTETWRPLSLAKEHQPRKVGPGYEEGDEWIREHVDLRRKMTISDTLIKETAIRRLAQEVEEEAQDDDLQMKGFPSNIDGESDSDPDTDRESLLIHLDALSDDGNESDDEGGLTDSDDESDGDFTNGFWTPGLTTAATSTDHLDHIRPRQDGRTAESSDEYLDESSTEHIRGPLTRKRATLPALVRRKQQSNRESLAVIDDFIIGTLDEDRARQEAYLSSFEERKRSKQKLIPQDIDPSFPTSDPDDDNDSELSEDNDQESVDGKDTIEDDDDEQHEARSGKFASIARPHTTISSNTILPSRHSNQRVAHNVVIGTPWKATSPTRSLLNPSRRLFGQHGPRLRSPPPPSRRLCSPPPSRRPSPTSGTSPSASNICARPRLAQNPNLTSTASLPRSENPFWNQHQSRRPCNVYRSATDPEPGSERSQVNEMHDRGPIDIVLGLEHKKQRRREKYWRMHCQKAHAGKDKERKYHSGKGVERMREVGLVMQDRFRGYGQLRPTLMLSI